MRDFILPLILLFLYTCTFNPFGIFPSVNHSMYFVTLIVVLALLLILVLKRKPQDERETFLEAKGSHSAYVVGQVIILGTILYEKLTLGMVSQNLVGVFLGMTLAEIVVRKMIERKS
jgi:hypothetical protein